MVETFFFGASFVVTPLPATLFSDAPVDAGADAAFVVAAFAFLGAVLSESAPFVDAVGLPAFAGVFTADFFFESSDEPFAVPPFVASVAFLPEVADFFKGDGFVDDDFAGDVFTKAGFFAPDFGAVGFAAADLDDFTEVSLLAGFAPVLVLDFIDFVAVFGAGFVVVFAAGFTVFFVGVFVAGFFSATSAFFAAVGFFATVAFFVAAAFVDAVFVVDFAGVVDFRVVDPALVIVRSSPTRARRPDTLVRAQPILAS